MTKYFKIQQALDERILGILEDSIKSNPALTENDKQALITTLLYKTPYEEKDPHAQRITLWKLESAPAAPDLLAALEGLVNVCTHPQSTKADMKRIAQEARAAIAQAKG